MKVKVPMQPSLVFTPANSMQDDSDLSVGHQRLIYPLEIILTGARFLKNTREIKYKSSSVIRSMILYTFDRTKDGWLPLNRDYKPLGLHDYNLWADYSNYKFLIIPEDKIDIDDNYFAFNDLTYPRGKPNKKLYFKEIERLFNISFPGFRDRLLNALDDDWSYFQ